MVNIKFKFRKEDYRIKSTTYDYQLSKLTGTRDAKENEEGDIVELYKDLGYFATAFGALSYLTEIHIKGSNKEINTFMELREEFELCMKDLREISKQFEGVNNIFKLK